MHRSHLGLCAIGLAVAVGSLVLTGGSAGGFGLLVAALVCPLAMVLAMTVLMGHGSQQPAAGRTQGAGDPVEPVDFTNT